MGIYEELQARGLIAQVTNEPEIREMVNNGKATFYIGFDPTLLSCAKKRRVEPPGRSCPKKTLQKGFLWTLSETKGLRPF